MAQVNFLWHDQGITLGAVNGNTTSAITAGDLLYVSGPSTSPFGTVVPSGIAPSDIHVEPVKFATAAGKGGEGRKVIGVALHDAPAGNTAGTTGYVTVAMEGLFLSPFIDTTGYLLGGEFVRAAEGTTTAGVAKLATTTGPLSGEIVTKVGYAINQANANGKYVLWKFSK